MTTGGRWAIVICGLAAGCVAQTEMDDEREIEGSPYAAGDCVTTTGARPPGSACSCDGQCLADGTHRGVCVYGVCMTRAVARCASAGSTRECGAGSRCWGVTGHDASWVCWPDCARYACAGACDSDGSCVPPDGGTCDPRCGGICPASGPMCTGGGSGGGGGSDTPTPGACPDFRCTGGCGDLVQMPGSFDRLSEQARRDGYFIATPAKYAFIRRDLSLLVRHAACEVARRFPGTAPIGISDLSQANGLTPGSDVGGLRHPSSTHRGNDLDIAYYQTDGVNNVQIICGDGTDRNGNTRPGRYNDGYFCTTERNIVDWPRQAFFFARMARSPLVRIFGVDRTLPDDFRTHVSALFSRGEITAAERDRALDLGYGSAGGWQFHHHHVHLSFCRTPGC